MKFRLSSLLFLILLVAVLAAWWTDRTALRNDLQRANQQAAEIATELYIDQLAEGSIKPRTWYESMRSSAPFSGGGGGVVVDLTTAAGRSELLRRMRKDDTDFVARTDSGRIVFGATRGAHGNATPPPGEVVQEPMAIIAERMRLATGNVLAKLKSPPQPASVPEIKATTIADNSLTGNSAELRK